MRWTRFLRFLPITFLAAQQGFLLFVPYLILFLATVELLHAYQRRNAVRVAFA